MRQDLRLRAIVFATAGVALAVPNVLGSAEPPALVAIVIDTSGSVGRAGVARARPFAEGLLAELSGGEVALFTFGDQSRLLLARTAQSDAVRAALSKTPGRGGHTALNDALYDAARYLEKEGVASRAIVLITDGRDAGSVLNIEDGLKVAQAAGIPVITLGVGRVDERVLRRIAKLTGGSYAPADRADPASVTQRLRSPGAAAVSERPAAVDGAAGRGPAIPFAAEAPPRSRRATLAWLLAGALLASASGAWALLHRGRARRLCPRCGHALANAFSACAPCAGSEGGDDTLSPTVKADLSPTVLVRLNTTEEYLDKTVLLRERPILSVTRGPGTGRIFELSRASALSVGRARANDIVLEDIAVSSQHCRIRPENGGFVVHDLKSTNGTFINERRVSHQSLAEGDVIQVGETCLEFRTEHRKA